MSEQLSAHAITFDQLYPERTDHEIAARSAAISLRLADTAMKLSRVERVPRYDHERRENDAEHSYMLALIATELAASEFPELDTGLVSQFAIAHELTELVLQDQQTFSISEAELARKKQNEAAVLDQLCASLPAHTATLLRAYEEQLIPEARFVSFVDKHLPVLVDILGSGSDVMHDDYGVHTRAELMQSHRILAERFRRRYPDEFLRPLHIALDGLSALFEKQFQPAAYIQDVLPITV